MVLDAVAVTLQLVVTGQAAVQRGYSSAAGGSGLRLSVDHKILLPGSS